MNLNEINKLAESSDNTAKMPVLFIGHGSPMNAIEENEFVQWMEGNWENDSKTQCNSMYLGALGNQRDICHSNGKTGYHSRFWWISGGVV